MVFVVLVLFVFEKLLDAGRLGSFGEVEPLARDAAVATSDGGAGKSVSVRLFDYYSFSRL